MFRSQRGKRRVVLRAVLLKSPGSRQDGDGRCPDEQGERASRRQPLEGLTEDSGTSESGHLFPGV